MERVEAALTMKRDKEDESEDNGADTDEQVHGRTMSLSVEVSTIRDVEESIRPIKQRR